jgi:ATP-dependent helicase/nuclease subunit A
VSKANSEQIKAIEHTGGVLLKAGAGSGKTFVLVNHIIYLTQKWMNEYRPGVVSFEETIRNHFAKVVMMTFTKKAAGEMSIRLNEQFEKMAQIESDDQEKWKICLDSLPMLTVTTIDGFSRRLITAGYFPQLSTEVNMIFEAERFDQVKILFNEWFEQYESKLQGDLREIIDREKEALLIAFRSIFSDSSLRLLWKDYKIANSAPEKLGETLLQSFTVNELEASLMRVHSLDLPTDKESGFEKNVRNFQNTGLPVVDTVEKLTLYAELFGGIARLLGQSAKTTTPAHEAALEGLQKLREWVKLWKPAVDDYITHYESKILPWLNICQSLFHYIDEALDPNQGMTFGDVEYFVALGLSDKETRERIQKQYSYFIVDEFQDTSKLQFRIIRDLIGNDFNRLFCVGDPKQAIYGFRGGEISVFQSCGKLVPQVLTLANNYRSLPNVIEFNNSLFRTILPVGSEYTEHDPFPVEAEDQNIPTEVKHDSQGRIEILHTVLDGEGDPKIKLDNDEADRLESEHIVKSIVKSRDENPNDVCTVLYRWLKPSADVIRGLMDNNIGFTAQYKIELMDEPLMGIFLVLMKRQFDTSEKTKSIYPLFMLRSYFSILRVSSDVQEDDLKAFDEDMHYWGILEAFKKMIFRLGITNENSDLNLAEIETLCRLYQEDSESILNQLNFNSTRISLDFRYGKNPHMVQIMTAHASKGLEFDRVYLGGLYTNGIVPPDKEIFGDAPDSFKWFLDLATKKTQKSPQLIFENELKKIKNFSESKRLFYVACTRAKKTLCWVDLENGAELLSRQKNSWIKGLLLWSGHPEGTLFSPRLDRIEFPPLKVAEVKGQHHDETLPLFFYDSVGILDKEKDSSVELGIAAELSVTRLNSLVDCSRKFYFENILKIKTTEEIKQRPLVQSDENEVRVLSSSERGSKIHEYISKGITENFTVHRDVFASELKTPIQWTLDQLRGTSSDHELISEKALKFKFFNFMISGIPDLIMLPKKKTSPAQIWDFKTGRITQESLSHYWIQLKTYAYALYELKRVEKTQPILLRLCFVDQQKFIDLSVDYSSIEPELFELWGSQNRPWKINTEHCSQCSYGPICPR